MTQFRELPTTARAFVTAVSVAGLLAVMVAWAARPPALEARILLFIFLAVVAGLVRVPLPVVGSLSLAYAFVFATLMGFGLGASTLASVLSALVSSLIRRPGGARSGLYRTAFNAGLVGIASSMAGTVYLVCGGQVGAVDPLQIVPAIVAYTLTFAVLNIGLLSIAIHVTGDQAAAPALRTNFVWAVPGYLAGSSLASLLIMLLVTGKLPLLLLAAPFAYLVHLAYRARTEQVEEETRHSNEAAKLYRAVTEALAMAIEAKDENTEEHLQRVQQYCLGIGEQLKLPASEMEALRAAALLHDIGKIAVPEYILTKPGRLTPEEAEKMMIHPRVGAEILGTVPFPYPIAPIVRHHHERWDGNGYPDRLAGESIPIGARILAAVDCYDALTSDRPYRKALTREEALDYLRRESGRMYDPQVVHILVGTIDRLEARVGPGRVESRLATGTEARTVEKSADGSEVLPRSRLYEEVSASKKELQALFEITRTVGHQLDLEECLTLLAAKISTLIPYRSFVAYLFDEERRNLIARFTTGQGASRLLGLSVPLGEKLSGWAALHQRPYTGRAHLNPLDRDGSRSDLEELAGDPVLASLHSAVVAPMSTSREQLGVLALYHDADFDYTPEHRRLLAAISEHVAHAIRNALLHGRARSLSLTDPLTGIPNSRFFFLEAEHRLGREHEDGAGLGVVALRLTELASMRAAWGDRAAERMVGALARRLAAACGDGETLVRFGFDLFLVLMDESRPQDLVARAEALSREFQAAPVEVRLGASTRPKVAVAQALYPDDGQTPDELLDALEFRLAQRSPREPADAAILPFPTGTGTGSPVSR